MRIPLLRPLGSAGPGRVLALLAAVALAGCVVVPVPRLGGFGPGYSLFGVILLALDIYAILKVAQSRATPGVKAVWIVVILLFPLLGFLLWVLLGPK